MRIAISLLLFSLTTLACGAQPLKYTAFTVDNGLPSNYVYRCIEDNKGFLWVATDAGIARFDGKHFQVFTTRNGLPDNEVLAVVKETNGRIWVNCFKQKPAYFDEEKNRFINAKQDTALAKIQEGTGVMYFFPLKNGGMLFTNEKGSFVYKDKKLQADSDGFFIQKYGDGSRLVYQRARTNSKTWTSAFCRIKNGKCIDSAILPNNAFGDHILEGLNDGKFYLFRTVAGKCLIYSNLESKLSDISVDSVSLPEAFSNFEFTYDSFYLLGVSGKIYLFNKNTLQREATIKGDFLVNSIYKDYKGNIWVSTIDKGLLLFKQKQFSAVEMPVGFTKTNFLSIVHKADGTLLAGNYYGEIIEARRNKIKINTIPQKVLIARQRKIIISQNKIFTFSESGVYVNYTKDLGTPAKTGIAYNDSIIIVGQSTCLRKLNTITGKLTVLTKMKRITAVTRDMTGNIYYGSTDGLYKFNYANNTTLALNKNTSLLGERVTALCVTPDNLLWVATAGSGIVVVKNDKVLLHFDESDGIINNATRSITAGGTGQVWLGTVGGISVIAYHLTANKVRYDIQNLSVNDGLTDNMINEMDYQKDTIYAATGNGISIIPANISIPKFNIPVQLTGLSINQRDTLLSPAYSLNYDQRNVQLQFAAIELSGHFKKLQYTLDKNKNWINLNENTLTIELNSGNHTVQVRAVDVNGNISDKILTLKFDIATPFWKSVWFWLVAAVTAQFIIINLINRWQKKQKEDKLAKQIAGVQTAALEQQAFTSLMNPHFMFNALNSIQHYINVQDRQSANRYLSDFASLIRKNFEAAQQSFIPMEQEMENIKIYLRLEQMRFNGRFAYEITVDENLDIEDWMIPTMILQPLLENALLHGIMPSLIDGKVSIELKELDKNLLIIITDNGIGIASSLALKEPNGHKSHGMELIKKRIAALSSFGEHAITIAMFPAFVSEKNPGNKITLFIPQELFPSWLQAKQ